MMDTDEILARVQEAAARAEARLVALSTDESLPEAQRKQATRVLKKWRSRTLGAEKSGKKRRKAESYGEPTVNLRQN